MTTRIAARQLARLLGKDDLYRRLGLDDGPEPEGLTAEQLALVHALVDERLGELLFGLAVETVASDDVIDAASALDYLEDRLSFLRELLTEEQRERIRRDFRSLVARWG